MSNNTITINRATKLVFHGFLGGAAFGYFMATKEQQAKERYRSLQEKEEDDVDDDVEYYEDDFDSSQENPLTSTSLSKITNNKNQPSQQQSHNKNKPKKAQFINTKKWVSLPSHQHAVLFDFRDYTNNFNVLLSALYKNYTMFEISIQFMNKNKLIILVRYKNQDQQQQVICNGLRVSSSTTLYPTPILDNQYHHTILIIKHLPLEDIATTKDKIVASLFRPTVPTIMLHQGQDSSNSNNNNNMEINESNIIDIYENYYPLGFYKGDMTVILRGKVINKGSRTQIYLEQYKNMYDCQFIAVPVTYASV
ncbi:hypothetical protein BJ944DRAFT_242273 [Cunninghamella echinulata]|nr:hypothetical protein BJ944DRAFT_242273 [Cunninghamella echinulata]